MKFPYGISHFETIATENYFYQDRTDRIPLVEETGKNLLFIRPRRFGKSLWLSTLRHYYDIAFQDRFEELFGGLAIGKNPTQERNRYFCIRWDFSCVDPTGTAADIARSLSDHLNIRARSFAMYYKRRFDLPEIRIDNDNGMASFFSILDAVYAMGHPFHLFIDEYDNFANEIMSGIRNSRDEYNALVHEKGPLKTLFKSLKSAAGEGLLERMFITGVSPVVMTDITSGFNIAEDIYLDRQFNDLCGFTEPEIRAMFRELQRESDIPDPESAMDMLRTYYNGYNFGPLPGERIYNPTMILYFFKHYQKQGEYPRQMLDANLATDEAKLEFAAGLPRGRQLLLDIVRDAEPVTITGISKRFGVAEMLNEAAKTHDFAVSFLYYFGVLSVTGMTAEGQLELRVPNLVVRGMYVNGIARFLIPDPGVRDDGRNAAEKVFTKGDIGPLAEFVETRYFQVFRNRDYRWANELTVKTAFLTLLYDDIRFVMDSERETRRGYADLTMIVRPDMRKYALLDVLIEFKFVTLAEANVTGEEARDLSPEEIQALPAMRTKMDEAKAQARRYAAEIEKKHGNLRLKTFAVASLGFERLWAESV
ncbi:MAG: AAA family ATPase [Desulfococcaceae bacterium]